MEQIMGTHEIVTVIQSVGFSIFVCLWFMLRLEKHLVKNTEATNRLITALSVLAKTLDLPEGDRVRVENLLAEKKEEK